MPARENSADVIVVGGGIIGCTLAYDLQKRGIQTLLLEQGEIAREASWASAGILAPPPAAAYPAYRQQFAELSAKRYETLLPEIAEQSGIETTWLPTGQIMIARTEPEVEHLQSQINWHNTHGFNTTWLERDQVQEIEPVIPDDILGACYAPDAGAVTLHRFTEAVAMAFRRIGGSVREHTPVMSVLKDGDRVSGVQTAEGLINAGTVVLSAGAWTGFIGAGIGLNVPTVPVKGQMISVTPGEQRPRHIIGNTDGGYLVPRFDGSVAIGASREDAGFDKRFTPKGFEHALSLIRALGPALQDASFVTGWAGLRPGSGDEAPIMGPVDGVDGLWLSTGHFRSGAQLAPGSAELIGSAIAEGKTSELLDHFTLNRFL